MTLASALFLIGSSFVKLPIPWSPIPISILSFSVALVSLFLGLPLAVVSTSLLLIFKFGMISDWGFSKFGGFPQIGYFVGMLFASSAVGYLSDRGYPDCFLRALGSLYIGSFLILGCGCFALSFYIPFDELLIEGVLPFLAGDFIKNAAAAWIYVSIHKRTFGSHD